MHNTQSKIKHILVGNVGTFLVLVVLMGAFSFLSSTYLTPGNLSNLLVQSATNAIIAVGMTFVIVSGNIDISVGSMLAASSCVGASIMVGTDSVALGIVAAILSGIVLGLFNGTLVAYLGFPPFIVTLSTMWLFRGFAYLYTNGISINGLPKSMLQLARGSGFILPNVVWLIVIIYVICNFLLQKTTYGRKICAVGDNAEAARLSGINNKRILLMVFAMSGLLQRSVAQFTCLD